jgi:hypothetical protein
MISSWRALRLRLPFFALAALLACGKATLPTPATGPRDAATDAGDAATRPSDAAPGVLVTCGSIPAMVVAEMENAARANDACATDTDCVHDLSATTCLPTCGAAVARDRQAAYRAAVAAISDRTCPDYAEACDRTLPACVPAPLRCRQNHCIHTPPVVANPVAEILLSSGRLIWARKKAVCGTYHYARPRASFTGWHATTTIEITNGKPSRRSYTASRSFGPNDAGADEQWDETGNQVGSHTAGDPALTVEQLLSQCDSILEQNPGEKVTVDISPEGAPTTCSFRPDNCADDCDMGFWLSGFACGPIGSGADGGDAGRDVCAGGNAAACPADAAQD